MVCTQFHWSEKDVLAMPYEKFTMYLSTVPISDYGDDDSGDDNGVKTPTKKAKEEGKIVNLFDYARGNV